MPGACAGLAVAEDVQRLDGGRIGKWRERDALSARPIAVLGATRDLHHGLRARRCATIPIIGMPDERPLFQHPPWMVGIMLILGVLSLVIGLTVDPFWLVMGSPAILTLVVFIGVRIAVRRRSGE